MAKKNAYIYHHTHWDNEWYFTEEDSNIQLVYHMKELLDALEKDQIDYFFLDGQTAIAEDYLRAHPEDRERMAQLISGKRLFVGPFHTQLDSFICSGESVVNNLKIGMRIGDQLGGANRVAYLPDSFGQSQDYPKLFREMDIQDFVFRRGMGDEHNLPNEFIWDGEDGSSVLCSALNCGYGFATEPFVNGSLLKNAGLDYDGKDIASQMRKLSERSALEDGFLLPIGNDQTPVIRNFKQLLEQYNAESEEYHFEELTLPQYMEKLRQEGKDLKHYKGEFLNPQYHRVHKSIGSARADIKNVQDRIERLMAYEIQPVMCILDRIGLLYDRSLTERIWNLLVRGQTHSGATNTDKTNELILKRSEIACNLAEALKVYLVRKLALSVEKKQGASPVVVFNSLPYRRDMALRMEVYTRTPDFALYRQGKPVAYTSFRVRREYGGTIRKCMEQYDAEKFYYVHEIAVVLEDMPAFGYETLYIHEGMSEGAAQAVHTDGVIENDYYALWLNKDGKLSLRDKQTGEVHEDILYWEESGDAGDNYDYSYPAQDWTIRAGFGGCRVVRSEQAQQWAELELHGSLRVPKNLEERARHEDNADMPYKIILRLKQGEHMLHVDGCVDNPADNHRVRLVLRTPYHTDAALAGTQFGVIARPVHPATMDIWKQEGWLEEPSPIDPLLNHVSVTDGKATATVYTRGVKEYEILENKDIALTLFRSVGYLGLPDLERRPGRASGLAERIIPSPLSQMHGENHFAFSVAFTGTYDANAVGRAYVEAAVTEIYYQNQRMNKVVYPISYFETNPLPFTPPEQFSLCGIEQMDGVFSTLCMSEDGKGYTLRLSNQRGESCEAGVLTAGETFQCCRMNIAETKRETMDNTAMHLDAGEICTIQLCFA